MTIIVQGIDQSNMRNYSQVDGSIWVDSRLCLSAEDGKISYSIVPVEGYLKPYRYDEVDPLAYIGNPERVMFFAFLDGQLAGQINLNKSWNRFAWVEDIVVDKKFRGQGVGQALMRRGVEWVKSQGLPGIRLETQDVRVAACRFYKRFGFVLGGFDRMLYRAFPEHAGEIALFWYLLF